MLQDISYVTLISADINIGLKSHQKHSIVKKRTNLVPKTECVTEVAWNSKIPSRIGMI